MQVLKARVTCLVQAAPPQQCEGPARNEDVETVQKALRGPALGQQKVESPLATLTPRTGAHVCVLALLLCLGKQWEIAQVSETLPAMWDTQMESHGPAFSLVQPPAQRALQE